VGTTKVSIRLSLSHEKMLCLFSSRMEGRLVDPAPTWSASQYRTRTLPEADFCRSVLYWPPQELRLSSLSRMQLLGG
jgi:hypothetical protein